MSSPNQPGSFWVQPSLSPFPSAEFPVTLNLAAVIDGCFITHYIHVYKYQCLVYAHIILYTRLNKVHTCSVLVSLHRDAAVSRNWPVSLAFLNLLAFVCESPCKFPRFLCSDQQVNNISSSTYIQPNVCVHVQVANRPTHYCICNCHMYTTYTVHTSIYVVVISHVGSVMCKHYGLYLPIFIR